MKGSRITATICTALAGGAFIGVLTGASHQLALAIPLTILAIVLFNKKTFKA